MSSQFGLGFFFVDLHVFVLVCMFVCSFVFEGRRELRVEGNGARLKKQERDWELSSSVSL